jgi:hypothetical protein
MFHKLYLAGASPPRLPGAGPGHQPQIDTHQLETQTLKEISHGH